MDSVLNDINDIKEYLSSLNTNVFGKEQIVKWFQDLCNMLCHLYLKISKNLRDAKQPLEPRAKDTMLLYLLQLNTALSVLINVFSTEREIGIPIDESRACILQQISTCVSGLEAVINSNAVNNDNSTGFAQLLDMAFDSIDEIKMEKNSQTALRAIENAGKVVEEVLCYAMSIAQVAFKDDCGSMKGSSKEILYNWDFLSKEFSKPSPNLAMCSLYVDATYDKLCVLERKVNTAVMKLALKGFSEYTKPLDDLLSFCLMTSRDGEALDELIADFDMHVDRIIQVGLFAIASSSDRNCSLKMRSCLASFEALEGELVPAVMALMKNYTLQSLHHVEILKSYWISQAQELKSLIYSILDPLAFCQVTFEVIRDINEDLEERSRDMAWIDKEHLKPIVLQSRILHDMLQANLANTPQENQDIIRNCLNDFIRVTLEIDAAAEQLLTEDNHYANNVLRVFKRCKVQKNVLGKLVGALENSEPEQSQQNNSKAPAGNSVSGRAKMNVIETDERSLEHIAIRGKQILQNRSVLYKSPTKTTFIIATNRANSSKPMPLSRLVHLRNMKFSHSRSIVDPSSCDLQITNILDSLSMLSSSLKY